MQVNVKVNSSLSDNEIIIECREENKFINEIKDFINSLEDKKIILYKRGQEYFVNESDIIFFETEFNSISAHTINDTYVVKYKLYELESILSSNFIRVSKSTIVNVNSIKSLNHNIASSSLIEFTHTYKTSYVSRFYYKKLKEKLKEKYEKIR